MEGSLPVGCVRVGAPTVSWESWWLAFVEVGERLLIVKVSPKIDHPLAGEYAEHLPLVLRELCGPLARFTPPNHEPARQSGPVQHTRRGVSAKLAKVIP